tara:strand:+ start:2500 stop:2769 length:270 start_codon:yes stop_codon:yes gene_type:complete
MADQKPVFETDDIAVSQAREQGLGIGARELAAQRDPGDVQSRDDEDVHVEPDDEAMRSADDDDGSVSVNAGDRDDLNESLGVQGAAKKD